MGDAVIANKVYDYKSTINPQYNPAYNFQVVNPEVSWTPCTSKDTEAYCLRPFADATALVTQPVGDKRNLCRNTKQIMELDPSSAFYQQCFYCDSTKQIYWPSITTTANNKWLPAKACDVSLTAAGIRKDDTPVLYFNETASEMLMGKIEPIDKDYPYGKGETTMCWTVYDMQTSASFLQKMSMIVMILLFVQTFLTTFLFIGFSLFKKTYRSDWGKINWCVTYCGCFLKFCPIPLSLGHTVSLGFCSYNLYLLMIGTCQYAPSATGEVKFYGMAMPLAFLWVGLLVISCFGCLFRYKVGKETAMVQPAEFNAEEGNFMKLVGTMKRFYFCLGP